MCQLLRMCHCISQHCMSTLHNSNYFSTFAPLIILTNVPWQLLHSVWRILCVLQASVDVPDTPPMSVTLYLLIFSSSTISQWLLVNVFPNMESHWEVVDVDLKLDITFYSLRNGKELLRNQTTLPSRVDWWKQSHFKYTLSTKWHIIVR